MSTPLPYDQNKLQIKKKYLENEAQKNKLQFLDNLEGTNTIFFKENKPRR